jgi:hypothetical protein
MLLPLSMLLLAPMLLHVLLLWLALPLLATMLLPLSMLLLVLMLLQAFLLLLAVLLLASLQHDVLAVAYSPLALA